MKLTSVTYTQDADSCSDGDLDGVQTIRISLRDAGGGDYYVIKTAEWAIDTPEEFLELFKPWDCTNQPDTKLAISRI